MFDDFNIVIGVLDTKELQAEMAKRLMGQFMQAPSNTTKGRIAEISNQLIGQEALKNFNPESLHNVVVNKIWTLV